MIHKINTSVDNNYWLKSLETQLNEPAKQNLIKVPKVDFYKTNSMIFSKSFSKFFKTYFIFFHIFYEWFWRKFHDVC